MVHATVSPMSDVQLAPPHEALARKAAQKKIGFYAHCTAWAAVGLFLSWTAGFTPTVIVLLSWGIGLAMHAFYAMIAPDLREKLVEQERARIARAMPSSPSSPPAPSMPIVHAVPMTPTPPVVTVTTPRDDGRRSDLAVKHARSLELLSAKIAHEIRNPITAARSLVAQIGEDPAAPENAEYARVALEELDRVERSITHLLRYARDEAPRFEEVTLASIVDSASETLRDRIAKSGVIFTRAVDGDVTVRADPEQLRRVVINLVGNAIEALEGAAPETACIDIEGGQNLAGTTAWLKVRDNGPGIPADRLSTIFEPFRTSKSKGTGLGLAIARKIVDAHGGTLEVRSQPGATEFEVVLPHSLSGAASRAMVRS